MPKRTHPQVAQTCWVCLEEKPFVFSCSRGHGMCAECHERSADATGIPTQCQALCSEASSSSSSSSPSTEKCLANIDQTQFLNAMEPSKRRRFQETLKGDIARAAQTDGEVVRKCEKCDFVAVDDVDDPQPWTCGNPSCLHVNPVKQEDFLKILEEAMVPVKCPGCKSPVVLEDGCTQIHCSTSGCGKKFCYCCETVFDSDLDIHAQYSDHYSNSCSCAREIEEYSARNKNWPRGRQGILDMLHNHYIERNLRKARAKNPAEFDKAAGSERGKAMMSSWALSLVSGGAKFGQLPCQSDDAEYCDSLASLVDIGYYQEEASDSFRYLDIVVDHDIENQWDAPEDITLVGLFNGALDVLEKKRREGLVFPALGEPIDVEFGASGRMINLMLYREYEGRPDGYPSANGQRSFRSLFVEVVADLNANCTDGGLREVCKIDDLMNSNAVFDEWRREEHERVLNQSDVSDSDEDMAQFSSDEFDFDDSDDDSTPGQPPTPATDDQESDSDDGEEDDDEDGDESESDGGDHQQTLQEFFAELQAAQQIANDDSDSSDESDVAPLAGMQIDDSSDGDDDESEDVQRVVLSDSDSFSGDDDDENDAVDSDRSDNGDNEAEESDDEPNLHTMSSSDDSDDDDDAPNIYTMSSDDMSSDSD